LALILKKDKFSEFLKALLKEYDVVAPVKEGDLINFKVVDKFDNLVMDYPKTVKSPKEFLFPQTELLCSYKFNGKDVDIVTEDIKDRKRVLVGIHPCDVKAILILDKLFDWDYRDEHYFARRENTLLISLTCQSPDWSCFCTSIEGSPHGKEGTDVHITDMGDSYYVETKSPKGEALIKGQSSLFSEASEEDKKKVEDLEKQVTAKLPGKIDTGKIKENLDHVFEHKVWDTVSAKCVHCGACAYLCPTCHCFDITDEGNYEEGKKFRCWDACMAGHFTRMAGGHNPRNAVKTRYRQRIYHKFNYYKKNFDTIACVGCGRCITECPTGMDLVKTLQTLETIERDK